MPHLAVTSKRPQNAPQIAQSEQDHTAAAPNSLKNEIQLFKIVTATDAGWNTGRCDCDKSYTRCETWNTVTLCASRETISLQWITTLERLLVHISQVQIWTQKGVNLEELLPVVIWYCARLPSTVLLRLNHNDTRILNLHEPLLYLPSWCMAMKKSLLSIWFSLELGSSSCTQLPFRLSTAREADKLVLQFSSLPGFFFFSVCSVVAQSVPFVAMNHFPFATRCHLLAWLTEVSLENTEMAWIQCSNDDGLLSSF